MGAEDISGGCAQCLFAEAERSLGGECGVCREVSQAASCLGGGLGIGSVCGVVIAAVMLIGLCAEGGEAKQMRMELICAVQDKYGSLNCCDISRCACKGCGEVIDFVTAELGKIFEKYGLIQL